MKLKTVSVVFYVIGFGLFWALLGLGYILFPFLLYLSIIVLFCFLVPLFVLINYDSFWERRPNRHSYRTKIKSPAKPRACGVELVKNPFRKIQVKEFPSLPPNLITWCIICQLDLEFSDDLAYCPHCGAPAHKPHILEWAKIKGYCPNCGFSLKQTDFLPANKLKIPCIHV